MESKPHFNMILSEKIHEVMDEWPAQWCGKSHRRRSEGQSILFILKNLWSQVESELEHEEEHEAHFKALWLIGYEISRDYLIEPLLSSLPADQRIKRIIEDGGPLLFAYYTSTEEEIFEECCVTFERVLRRSGQWESIGSSSIAH